MTISPEKMAEPTEMPFVGTHAGPWKHVLDGGIYGRHLANMSEWSALGGLLLPFCSNLLNLHLILNPQHRKWHNQTFGVWIIKEYLETVDKVSSIERVTADADAQSLTKSSQRGLMNSLIRQRSRTWYDAWISPRLYQGRKATDTITFIIVTTVLLLQLLQPFYSFLDFVQDYPGKLVPER